jgi:hypothetical protein
MKPCAPSGQKEDTPMALRIGLVFANGFTQHQNVNN